jgi:serine/threonine protein kinase
MSEPQPPPDEENPREPHPAAEQLDRLIDARLGLSRTTPLPSEVEDERKTLLPVIDRLHSFAAYLAASPELPRSVGKYLIGEELGAGGQAITCKARDPDLERDVVLKIFHSAISADEQETILREGRALASVESPYVARCHTVDRHEGMPFLVVEYVAGGSLAQRHKDHPLSITAALELVGRLAEGLAAVHARDVRHRDIKPENILVGDDGQPRLIDFGLTVRPGEDSTSLVGTLAYMAPEQARGDSIDARTDLFGLGGVLYFLLTGRPPHNPQLGDSFEQRLERARACRITPPRALNPAVPAAVNDLCLKCLAPDPRQRFESARELERAIRRLLRWRRLRWPLGGALAACLALAVLAWACWPRPKPTTPVQDPGTQVENGETRNASSAPLEVESLNVLHYASRSDKKVFDWRLLGTQSGETKVDDFVMIRAQLSEAAYTYLLAFNFNGEEQLLLPVGANLTPDPSVRPPRARKLSYPPGKEGFELSDDAVGGLQAFVVVASRTALPPYAAWRKTRGRAAWRKLPPGKGVWFGDRERLDPTVLGVGRVRGRQKGLPGAPPLTALCRSLVPAGSDWIVEAVAFPVRAKEGRK